MRYRPEIDGLRALSVSAIVMFHAGFAFPSGGFLCVDVFFVISGFLITSIILNELDAGTFSFLNFFEMRARRILPALVLMIFCCLPFAWFWLLPDDMRSFSRSLFGVATFLSNVIFWTETGYFDPGADLKPMLHTWSIAVEEQYYIIFPVIMVAIFRFGYRSAVLWLAIPFVASLAAAEWAAYNAPSAGFYLLPMRAWELLIGSFAALYRRNRGRRPRMSGRSLAAETLGLAMICAAIFFYTDETPHPSVYTLLPTIGAALVILFSRHGSPIHLVLASRPLVGIGLISYSLYLWHFPVFAFYRYRTSLAPADGPWPILIVAILALSYLSWRYVEMPFRNSDVVSRPVILGFGVASMGALALLGAGGEATRGYHSFRPAIQQVAVDTPAVRVANCADRAAGTRHQVEARDPCATSRGAQTGRGI